VLRGWEKGDKDKKREKIKKNFEGGGVVQLVLSRVVEGRPFGAKGGSLVYFLGDYAGGLLV